MASRYFRINNKKLRFEFRDFVDLQDSYVIGVLRNIHTETLLIALDEAPADVVDRFKRLMSGKSADHWFNNFPIKDITDEDRFNSQSLMIQALMKDHNTGDIDLSATEWYEKALSAQEYELLNLTIENDDLSRNKKRL